ncbi:MAG: hypothetical protein ACRC46_09370 [Thermoguttaceae bacterium]
MKKQILALFALTTLCIVTGCTNSDKFQVVAVSGKLTCGGQPVHGVLLTLAPTGDGRMSTAEVKDDGSFTMMYTEDRKGAQVGEHKVSIAANPLATLPKQPFRDALLKKYSPQNTTHLIKVEKATSDLEIALVE